MTKIISLLNTSHDDVVRQAVHVLEGGGLVVYPTETVYGIGVDATNSDAIAKLLQYKSRREGKPLSVAVSNKEMASRYVEINAVAANLYDNFLPGPLTVVSKGLGKVASGVQSEFGTLGVRIPDYALVCEIVSLLDKPITATSANASYQKRPYKIQDIFDSISSKQIELIDLVIDAGELPKRDPSTVVDTTLNQEVVLRQGSLKLSEVLQRETCSAEETQALGEELMKRYYQYLGYKSVIFALQGELGAGKTQMTKGVARILGIPSEIQSPTFIIEREYSITGVDKSFVSEKNLHLYHIDTWRLFDEQELRELEFFEKVERGNVFVIEWADKVQSVIEQVASEAVIVWVKIEYGQKEDRRSISVGDYVV